MNLRVLIAEDDRLWSDRLRRVFEATGHEVVSVRSWDGVINRLRSERFDKFTCDLDLGLPPEQGLAVLNDLVGLSLPNTVVISNTLSADILSAAASLPFVKLVVLKPTIEESFEQLAAYVGGIEISELERVFHGVSKISDDFGIEISNNGKNIFVIHGRNQSLVDDIFLLLRLVDLLPQPFAKVVNNTKSGAPYIGQAIMDAISQCAAAIVILSPDDEVRLRKFLRNDSEPTFETKLTGQARPNVLFEAGLAFAVVPDRTILLRIGDVRPFSDVDGRHYLNFDGSNQSKNELIERLRAIGCKVDTSDGSWIDKVNFSASLSLH